MEYNQRWVIFLAATRLYFWGRETIDLASSLGTEHPLVPDACRPPRKVVRKGDDFIIIAELARVKKSDLPPQAAGMSCYSVAEEIMPGRAAAQALRQGAVAALSPLVRRKSCGAKGDDNATTTPRFRRLPGDRFCRRRSLALVNHDAQGSRTQTRVSPIDISIPARYSIERLFLQTVADPFDLSGRAPTVTDQPRRKPVRRAARGASRYGRESYAGARSAARRRLRVACPARPLGRRP
jgi:hypothetical protein